MEMERWCRRVASSRISHVRLGSRRRRRLEALHYGFPEHSITLTNNARGSFALTAKENVDTVKGRISYLFGIH